MLPRPAPRPCSRTTRPQPIGLAGLALLLLGIGFFPSALRAEGEVAPIFAAAQSAVRDGHIDKSRVLGFHDAKKVFTELPAQGAVLIGFDLGVGKFFNIETVYALRPVYRTAWGETSVRDHGLFRDRWLARNKVLKSKVLRTVSLRAQPGYAVGGITLRSGLNINGLSVTFMRINGRSLDPQRAYTSAWVGDRTGGHEAFMGGNGAPVIGVFGSEDTEHIQSLGLLLMNIPAAPPPPDPPRNEKPVTRPADPPQEEKQAAQPADPPRDEKPAEQPADPPKDEQRADPPRKAVEPIARTNDSPDKAPVEEPASAGMIWIPIVMFGTVTLGIFVALLLSSGRREKVEDFRPRELDLPQALPATAAPSPPPAPTAICERPQPAGEGRRPERQTGKKPHPQ